MDDFYVSLDNGNFRWYCVFMPPENPTSPETQPEHIPTPEEVSSQFQKFIREQLGKEFGGDYQDTQHIFDDHGFLCELEWRIPGSAKDTDPYFGIAYMRRKVKDTLVTEIHWAIIEKDENGEVTGTAGSSAVKYVNGNWTIVPLDTEELEFFKEIFQ